MKQQRNEPNDKCNTWNCSLYISTTKRLICIHSCTAQMVFSISTFSILMRLLIYLMGRHARKKGTSHEVVGMIDEKVESTFLHAWARETDAEGKLPVSIITTTLECFTGLGVSWSNVPTRRNSSLLTDQSEHNVCSCVLQSLLSVYNNTARCLSR